MPPDPFRDIDADGDIDALIANSFTDLRYFANTGSASAPAFAPPQLNPFGLPGGQGLSFVDADGDGDFDVFAGQVDGSTRFHRNTGSTSAPAFAAAQTHPFGLTRVSFSVRPAFADLDADGDPDAFLSGGFGGPVFFENVLVDASACADGLDNDGDARVDFPSDKGSASAADTNELSVRQCDNGLDDDGDAKIDHRLDASGDPQCSGLLDDREAPDPPLPPGSGCGLGPELLLLAPLLAAERRRRRAYTAGPCPSPTPTPTSSSCAAR
jgi:hypothetical protein